MYSPYNFYIRSTDPSLTDEGQLHISVFDTTRGRPVTNAEIRVTPRGNNSNIIITETTNNSGNTRNN